MVCTYEKKCNGQSHEKIKQFFLLCFMVKFLTCREKVRIMGILTIFLISYMQGINFELIHGFLDHNMTPEQWYILLNYDCIDLSFKNNCKTKTPHIHQ